MTSDVVYLQTLQPLFISHCHVTEKMNKTLENEAKHAAGRAVLYDNDRQYKQAICYYNVAASLLSKLPEESPLYNKADEYRERIAKLQKIVEEEERRNLQNPNETELHWCKYLFNEALNEDEAGWKHTAVTLYIEAAQLGLNMRKRLNDPATKDKLKEITECAITRAESLEKKDKNTDFDNSLALLQNLPPVPETILPGPTSDERTSPTSSNAFVSQAPVARPSLHRGSSAHLKMMGPVGNYTEEERRVLYHTSHINDNEFVPFMRGDLDERFQLSSLFTDPDGLLELAPKQQMDLPRWARPSEIFSAEGSKPVMVMGNHVDYYSIKQTVVSDCSFVASLAVSAQYEKRFGRALITSIIYPQNKNNKPVYNPSGKYMVKLHINGVKRKVIIDDRLPVGRDNQLLCSYSSNRGELWISLLEKAYMKVMGGYDFPGSNSNIDLHALTGWIPERRAIRPNEPDFNKDGLFRNLLKRWPNGHVLATVATGELSDAVANKTGLVPTHAYAVLNIRQINNTKLLLLKNPWSHLRWRGNYSEHDVHHWTSELQKTLNYDPQSASQFDNGIFWIDYDSICEYFDVFYLNWNPGVFTYTYCIHQMWQAGVGPIKDRYNIGCNPQFSLEVQQPGINGAVWILLTRHITDIADFRQNQEYITVLVYKNDGKRVYYPHDPPPYIDGVRINSPHYLTKIKLDSQSESRYTLVISQYENMNTIYYTLRAYGTCPFILRKIEDPYRFEKEITDGQWIGESAGGCGKHSATYWNNPRYQLTLKGSTNNNHLLIILKGPKQYQIGFDLSADSETNANFANTSSGPFRSGFVYLELQNVPGGTYTIVPSTYTPQQEGPFFLTCKSSCELQLVRIQ